MYGTGDGLIPNSLAVSPNGRVIAVNMNSPTQEIQFWDTLTGKKLASLTGHEVNVMTLTFTPDGQRLVTGMFDTTALVWDVPAAAKKVTAFGREKIPAGGVAALWKELGSPDPKRGQAAAMRLVRDPESALAIAERELQPARRRNEKDVQALIEKLGVEDFKQRQAAHDALAALGDWASPKLAVAARTTTNPEIKLRVNELLKNVRGYPLPASSLHSARAVQVLEWIGDARAKAILGKLVAGDPELFLTREAQAALGRLNRR
jgi:hypothetical protein